MAPTAAPIVSQRPIRSPFTSCWSAARRSASVYERAQTDPHGRRGWWRWPWPGRPRHGLPAGRRRAEDAAVAAFRGRARTRRRRDRPSRRSGRDGLAGAGRDAARPGPCLGARTWPIGAHRDRIGRRGRIAEPRFPATSVHAGLGAMTGGAARHRPTSAALSRRATPTMPLSRMPSYVSDQRTGRSAAWPATAHQRRLAAADPLTARFRHHLARPGPARPRLLQRPCSTWPPPSRRLLQTTLPGADNVDSFYTTARRDQFFNVSTCSWCRRPGLGRRGGLRPGRGGPTAQRHASRARASPPSPVRRSSFAPSRRCSTINGRAGWESRRRAGAPPVPDDVRRSAARPSRVRSRHRMAGVHSCKNISSFASTTGSRSRSLQDDLGPGLVLLFRACRAGRVGYNKVANGRKTSRSPIDGFVQTRRRSRLCLANVKLRRLLPLRRRHGAGWGAGRSPSPRRPTASTTEFAVVPDSAGAANAPCRSPSIRSTTAGAIDWAGAPGHADYAAAAQGRAYQTHGGRHRRSPGAGYGQFSEVLLKGVDAGDIIAMRLDNLTTGAFFWAFASANEKVERPGRRPPDATRASTPAGWEDTYGLRRPGLQRHDRAARLHQRTRHGWLV